MSYGRALEVVWAQMDEGSKFTVRWCRTSGCRLRSSLKWNYLDNQKELLFSDCMEGKREAI